MLDVNRAAVRVLRAIAALATLAWFTATPAAAPRGPGISAAPQPAPRAVRIAAKDGGSIQADEYGDGPRGVVLAHGGRFNKESWSSQARELARSGFRVVAINFRGYGDSRGPGQADVFTAPLHLDVLAAADYLRKTGATSVAAIGGSLGGGAIADAVAAAPGSFERIILLGATPQTPAGKLTGPKLYIATRDDASGDGPRLPGLQKHFDAAPEPKELILLDGSAHAQFMFDTEHAPRVMKEILRFLSAR